ncbi:MAG: hypothetical protein LHV68_04585 [Elusimicrobia bacterium]|nr:hypothetical protein [Candidatus Liberimonas magnetica]
MKRCLMLLMSVLFSFSLAYAGISILPMRFEYLSDPGDVFEGAYKITNQEKNDVRVDVNSKDYYIADENTGMKQETWFEMPVREFDLKPEETKEVKFKVKVPKDAKGFLMVLNSYLVQNIEKNGEVADQMLKTQYSIPVYVRIRNTEKFGLDIGDLELSGNSFEVNAMAKVSNIGNSLLRPFGSVEIYRKGFLLSKKTGNFELKQGWPVFPKQTETYQGKKDGFSLKGGKYKAVLKIWTTEPVTIRVKKSYNFILANEQIKMLKKAK